MIIDQLAYKVTIQANEFLNGSRKVEQESSRLKSNLERNIAGAGGSFNKVTQGMKGMQEQGQRAFSGLQLGAAKFLGVALTFEAARSMFMSTTKELVQLGNASGFLGMSAKSLDGFTRAANSAGVAGGSMTSMLGRIKNAQLWARTGMGAPDESTIAIQQLQSMTGVNVIGAKDPGQGLLRQAQALRKLSRDQAQVMWQRMGGSGDMFNLMYSGNLATLQKDFQQRSNATPEAIKQAQDVTKTLEELKASAASVGQEFVQTFGVSVNDALKELSDWMNNNKDNILGFFRQGAHWATEFANALNGTSNGLHKLLQIGGFNLLTGFDKPLIDVKGAINRGGRISIDPKAAQSANPSNPYGLSIPGSSGISGFAPINGNNIDQQADENGRRTSETLDEILSWIKGSSLISKAGAAEISPTLGSSGAGGFRIPGRVSANGSLMDALMMVESGGNPLARNPSGATGAFQLMAGTARGLGLTVNGNQDDRLDMEKSRAAASVYMSQLLKRYGGNVTEALQAYNWGMGNMDAYKRTGRGVNGQAMPRETIEYASKVAAQYARMNDIAGQPTTTSGSVDQSQTNSTHIQSVNVYSNPDSADKLTKSIEQQAQRSHITVTMSGGVNP